MLTERIIREAKPEQKTRILWDTALVGLGVRITPKGAKSYVLNYRVNGRERRVTLARVAEVSLKGARKLAGEQLLRIRAGEDPLERKEEPLVSAGVSRFFDEFVPDRIALGKMTERTAGEYRFQWEHYLAPKLARLRVAEVRRRHVEKAVAGTPNTTRNRLLALVSRLFNLFEEWEWRPQHTNPCRGVERGREEARDRVLSPSELAALAKALDRHADRNPAAVAAIRVAALTGLRIGEVLAIRWEHIDFESGRLTLPQTKTGRRQHDLPAAALDVLAGIPRFCEWAFSATGKAPCTYRNVRLHFQQICAAAGIVGARLHDLRRTAMTTAAAAGVGSHVLRDLLGHKTTVMADRYIRQLGNPVREARERVGAKIAMAMAGEGGNRG